MVPVRRGEIMRGSQPGRVSAANSGATEAAAPDVDFDAAHADLIADPAIQFELRPVEMPSAPYRKEQPVQGGASTMPAGEAGPVALAIFWIVIALAAAGLIYLILARLAGWRISRQGAEAEAEPEWRIEEAPARRLLDDADVLAAEGRYSEAAHLLLQRSIAEIDRRRPAAIRKALTSRDIAGLPAIPPSPAAAFRAIVAMVERSLFGARALDASDWRDCRAAYERFAFAREWQA
jgi:hypothetical protein